MKRPKKDSAPTAPASAPGEYCIPPSTDVPESAIAAAGELIQRFGVTLAIRGLDCALSRQPAVPASQLPDIAEGVRMVQMRRRVAQ